MRADRRTAAALDAEGHDEAWIDGMFEFDAEVAAHDAAADDAASSRLPSWPNPRVTTAMKRCIVPERRGDVCPVQ